MKTLLKILLPIAILAVGAFVFKLVLDSKKEAPREEYQPKPRVVRVMSVSPETQRFDIKCNGFVQARASSTISAEVAGKIVSVDPRFYSGEFFAKDSVILRIDPSDYEAAVKVAESRIAAQKARFAEEKVRAEQALENWKRLGRTGTPSPMVLREPQLEENRRAIAAAEAELTKAQNNLRRTEVRAPFDALITAKPAEIGQYVTPGSPLVTLQAIDFAEVRLPISREDLRFLSLPHGFGKESGTLPVEIRTDDQSRPGVIVRTENVIDERTRSLFAVARIQDPYLWKNRNSKLAPLPVGQFVTGVLKGTPVEDIVKLPRVALRRKNEVVLAEENDILKIHQIEVVHDTEESVFVRGLEKGDRVVLTAPPKAISGERVVVEALLNDAANDGPLSLVSPKPAP